MDATGRIWIAVLVIVAAGGLRVALARWHPSAIRWPSRVPAAGRPLEVVTRVNVAPDHWLAVVRFGDRQLLLAMSGRGCTVVDRLDNGAGTQARPAGAS